MASTDMKSRGKGKLLHLSRKASRPRENWQSDGNREVIFFRFPFVRLCNGGGGGEEFMEIDWKKRKMELKIA